MNREFTYKGTRYFIEDDKYYKEKFGKKLNVRKRDFEKFQKKADDNTCQHEEDEDCMTCAACGECREDLDSNDLCMDCGGVDENDESI